MGLVRRYAGHSKWAKIKRDKMAADMKRGQLYAKLGMRIISAVREHGMDVKDNPRLAAVLAEAKKAQLPKENLEAAFLKVGFFTLYLVFKRVAWGKAASGGASRGGDGGKEGMQQVWYQAMATGVALMM